MENEYCHITGRVNDTICQGGGNWEIEKFLNSHLAIEDIAVVGVPDPKFVEELAAWIKLKERAAVAEKEILQCCKGKLARYKISSYIRFVAEFPQTVTGKIQKFKIREAIIVELNQEQAETA